MKSHSHARSNIVRDTDGRLHFLTWLTSAQPQLGDGKRLAASQPLAHSSSSMHPIANKVQRIDPVNSTVAETGLSTFRYQNPLTK